MQCDDDGEAVYLEIFMSALGIALLSLGLLAAGAAIGFYLARLGQAAEQAKLDEVESEFDTYREQVTEHFAETASRFTAIGQQYRELYDHLAAGSEALCLTDKIEGKLPFPPAEAQQIAADEGDAVSETAGIAEDGAEATPLASAGSDVEPEAAAEAPEAAEEVTADPVTTAEIDSADEPLEAPAPDEADDDGDAERGSQTEAVASAPADADSVEPLEGEIVDEDATVTDNVVELVPRGEAREDDTGATAGTADDEDDKRTYH